MTDDGLVESDNLPCCESDACGYENALPKVRRRVFGVGSPSYHDLAHLFAAQAAEIARLRGDLDATVDLLDMAEREQAEAQAAEIARLTHQRDDASVRGGELATRITELQGLTFQQGQEIARLGEVVGGYRIDVLLRQMRALEREQAEDRAAIRDLTAAVLDFDPCHPHDVTEMHAPAIARAALRDEGT